MGLTHTRDEVAAEFGVSLDTVQRWVDQRRLISLPDGDVPARALDVFRTRLAELRAGDPDAIDFTAAQGPVASALPEVGPLQD